MDVSKLKAQSTLIRLPSGRPQDITALLEDIVDIMVELDGIVARIDTHHPQSAGDLRQSLQIAEIAARRYLADVVCGNATSKQSES
jgi:hypothetical protein